MLPHEIPEFSKYPNVHTFLKDHVSMQFGDVREMLRLPLPALKMTHACNFAAAGTLCSLISGISVSIYQPDTTTKAGRNSQKKWVDPVDAFRPLLEKFYPWATGQDPTMLSAAVYNYFRNPLAHALGVHKYKTSRIQISRLRIVDQYGTRQETGLTERQIQDLEQLAIRPPWVGPGLTGSGNNWTLCVEGFYRDILELLQKLAKDSIQMNDAELRFQQDKPIWRSGTPV